MDANSSLSALSGLSGFGALLSVIGILWPKRTKVLAIFASFLAIAIFIFALLLPALHLISSQLDQSRLIGSALLIFGVGFALNRLDQERAQRPKP